MNCFAKVLLFTVVAIAAIGIVGMESAEARCFGYNGWYSAPSYYPGGYYYTPYCGGYGYGGYGYGGYGGYSGYGYGGYGCGYGGW